MRAYVIAALAALAMILAIEIASTKDRTIDADYCRVDCLVPEADADNGVGTASPTDPNRDDGEDDKTRDQ